MFSSLARIDRLRTAIENHYKRLLKRALLRHLSSGALAEANDVSYPLDVLELAMVNGLGNEAIKHLDRTMKSEGSNVPQKIAAAWGLARLYAGKGDEVAALGKLRFIRESIGATKALLPSMKVFAPALEVDQLTKVGQLETAKRVLFDAAKKRARIEYDFLECNIWAKEKGQQSSLNRLDVINRHLASGGFHPLRLIKPDIGLCIDNVTSFTKDCEEAKTGPFVSVILPAFNAAETIEFAMRSVLEQTWSNLELVVVDDASTDGTPEIVAQIRSFDARVRLVRHERNRGVYAAQNTGLNLAVGELLTVHGADDWSHSQRLEVQVKDIIAHGRRSNTTDAVRVNREFCFETKPQSGGQIVTNLSSLLVTRTTLSTLGGWDEVRFSADAELKSRLELIYGSEPHRLNRLLPLAFLLTAETTLTKVKATSIALGKFGARGEYKASSEHWRKLEGRGGNLRLPRHPRPFPVPRICLHRDNSPVEFELLYITNLQMKEEVLSNNISGWRTASERGVYQGLYHWPSMLYVEAGQATSARQAIHENVVHVAVWGERMRCSVLVVEHAHLLEHSPDLLPEIEAQLCVVRDDLREDASAIKSIENLRKVIGSTPIVAFVPGRKPLKKWRDLGVKAIASEWMAAASADEWLARVEIGQ